MINRPSDTPCLKEIDMAKWASWMHKWLALLMAVQILFWFVSGLFFALAPIETVRSEHRIATPQAVTLDPSTIGSDLAAIDTTSGRRPISVEIRSLLGRPVAEFSYADDRPTLFDLSTRRQISPISAQTARRLAEDHLAGDAPAVNVSQVLEESTEYRGALPAWRVDFEQANRAVYVAADTGEVTARRSTLWRTFDFLWSLHIMDFQNHEDFNTPLLAVATVLGLVIILTGIVMFPSRLGYNAWRRRRKRRQSAQ
ncbi:MAG: PepSY domain-containing protein [Parasphingopyxis sp.]|uniref:PepSY domain-containing protein n=1 Tax=Parasphingopyxis sp. TaxID=1920299 RepID=UPI0032EECB2B